MFTIGAGVRVGSTAVFVEETEVVGGGEIGVRVGSRGGIVTGRGVLVRGGTGVTEP